MKIYSILVSIVAVLSIGAAVYFWLSSNNFKGQVEGARKEKADAESQLADIKKGLLSIQVTTAAFQAVNDSFIAPGNVKIDKIDSTKGTLARQKLGDITDQKDKEMAEKNWDQFKTSLSVSDFQSLLRTLSDNMDRNLSNQNIK